LNLVMLGLLIFKSLWFFLPAGIANMTPVLVKKINFLNFPVDLGKIYRGKPLFGKNKTYRGFFFGTLGAIITVLIQKFLYSNYEFFQETAVIPLDQYSPWLVGFLMGFGALFGDLAESFVKRRVNVAPGERFFPWDQLDFVFGFLILISIIHIPEWSVIICLIVLLPLFHIGVNYLGYYLKIKDSKW